MSSLFTTMEGIVGRKMARRKPHWPGPGNATTESALLVIPGGRIPDSFVEAFNNWAEAFNEQCIADGQSPEAQVGMVAADGNGYKLRAVS